MLVGGGAASASGGIKQARMAILLKSALRNLRQKFNDRRIIPPDSIHALGGKSVISDEDRAQAGLFALVYLSIFAMGTLAYCFFGYSIQDSAFEFASALGTVGFSTGITNYAAPSGVLWVGIAGMLLGRLEIYVVFMGFARIAKDAADAIHGR
jgi:trk system potassium uptake protein TrkH